MTVRRRYDIIVTVIGHNKRNSELIAGQIDEEVRKIVDTCYAKGKEIILSYEDVLHSGAKLLLEKEKITREEFEGLFENHQEIIDVTELVPNPA